MYEEMMECLAKTHAQLEMARLCYEKYKGKPVFETDQGKRFKGNLAAMIKNEFLAEIGLCIMMLEEIKNDQKDNFKEEEAIY